MLFGNKDRFAVESELIPGDFDYPFGRITFWSDGNPLGDYSAVTILTVDLFNCRSFLKDTGQRHDPTLETPPNEEALKKVYDAIYDPSVSDENEMYDLLMYYSKFCLCPNGS